MNLQHLLYIIIYWFSFFNGFKSQDLEFPICIENGQDYATVNLNEIQRIILENYTEYENYQPTIYITSLLGGTLKYTNFDSTPSLEVICNEGDFEIAVNSEEEIFVSGLLSTTLPTTQLYELGDNCYRVPVEMNYEKTISGMDFDNDDNLYVNNGWDAQVFRANADDYSYFELWHDFEIGTSSGDIAIKDNLLYMSWLIGDDNFLYEVQLGPNNEYISHENLGQIRDGTFGLAMEYGILYGVTSNVVYKIELPSLSMPIVFLGLGTSWSGASGVHKETANTYTFYETAQDAQNQINPISNSYILSPAISRIIYFRINSPPNESQIFSIQLKVEELPQINLPAELSICKSELNQHVLDTELNENEYEFRWFINGQNIENSNQSKKTITQAGEYTVEVSPLGYNCSTSSSSRIQISNITIDEINLIDNGALEITAIGDHPPFNYQIQGKGWQDSPIFSNLENGQYYFRAVNNIGCLSEWKEISINAIDIKFTNVITPNGDGINDQFIIPYGGIINNVSFHVFDIYNKEVYSAKLKGNDTWDATYLGRSLPNQTYWYLIRKDGKVIQQGYILVKNY